MIGSVVIIGSGVGSGIESVVSAPTKRQESDCPPVSTVTRRLLLNSGANDTIKSLAVFR